MNSEAENAVYALLDENEVRLLIVLPAEEDGDLLQCKIVHTKLDVLPRTGNEGPFAYDALSYMWGPPQPATEIHLNNRPFTIRQNLFLALKALRRRKSLKYLWADAICINQEDLSERGAQVAIMSTIFRLATKVVVWVGEGSEETDLLFSILAGKKGRFDVLDRKFSYRADRSGHMSKETKYKVKAAFLQLCQRPYWKRLWVIQEILAGTLIELHCGFKSLQWIRFSAAFMAVECIQIEVDPSFESRSSRKTFTELQSCLSTPAHAIAQKYSQAVHSYLIRELLSLCSACHSECEDFRDRIYGVISLADDINTGLIRPDYSKSALEIYLDLCRAVHSARRNVYPRFSHYREYGDHGNDESLLRLAGDLLLGPLWDYKTETNFSSRYLQLESWLQNFQTHSDDLLTHYCECKIVAIGETISPSTRTDSSTVSSIVNEYFSQSNTFIDPHFQTDQQRQERQMNHQFLGTVESDLWDLSVEDFHSTAFVGDAYVVQGGSSSTYRRKSMETWWERSDGLCRPFITASGMYGIASFHIQAGDRFCHMMPWDIYCVIRPGPPGGSESYDGFILIGSAIAFKRKLTFGNTRPALLNYSPSAKPLHPYADSWKGRKYGMFIEDSLTLFVLIITSSIMLFRLESGTSFDQITAFGWFPKAPVASFTTNYASVSNRWFIKKTYSDCNGFNLL